jgi:riboflavin biosynthesis pyrimidine reductase
MIILDGHAWDSGGEPEYHRVEARSDDVISVRVKTVGIMVVEHVIIDNPETRVADLGREASVDESIVIILKGTGHLRHEHNVVVFMAKDVPEGRNQ